MSSGKAWQEIKSLTNQIHSCQSPAGVVNKKDRAEAVALERQRQQAQRSIELEANKLLKSQGFTATGQKRKVRL